MLDRYHRHTQRCSQTPANVQTMIFTAMRPWRDFGIELMRQPIRPTVSLAYNPVARTTEQKSSWFVKNQKQWLDKSKDLIQLDPIPTRPDQTCSCRTTQPTWLTLCPLRTWSVLSCVYNVNSPHCLVFSVHAVNCAAVHYFWAQVKHRD